jgi:hypothetical protein
MDKTGFSMKSQTPGQKPVTAKMVWSLKFKMPGGHTMRGRFRPVFCRFEILSGAKHGAL